MSMARNILCFQEDPPVSTMISRSHNALTDTPQSMIRRMPLSRHGQTSTPTPLDFLRTVMVAQREGEAADVVLEDAGTSKATEVLVAAALRSPPQDRIKIATSPALSLSRYPRTSSAKPPSGNSSTSSAQSQTSICKPTNA
jgi:hypothetical protein